METEDGDSTIEGFEYNFVTCRLEIPNEQIDGPSSLKNYREAISGTQSKVWIQSMREKNHSLADDVF